MVRRGCSAVRTVVKHCVLLQSVSYCKHLFKQMLGVSLWRVAERRDGQMPAIYGEWIDEDFKSASFQWQSELHLWAVGLTQETGTLRNGSRVGARTSADRAVRQVYQFKRTAGQSDATLHGMAHASVSFFGIMPGGELLGEHAVYS